MLTVTVTSFHGAVAQRFFLGLVESAVSPGFVLGALLSPYSANAPLSVPTPIL